ncbi:MAG TPA: glutathione S-transferase family protein [Casimicrobiaceae bacterium]|jgi:glutathione S-transferase|nr:glutathione S-transferase family protein [Casimicrobiaceae bacterium]
MITIYHLDTSRSERIVWLMEELGLEYKLELFQRNDNGSAPDAMRKIHALGKAPVIRDGNTVLAESGAIVDYIVHRYAGDRLAVAPAAADYARYIYWFHFAEGSLMSLLILALVLSRVPEADASPARTRVLERMKQTLAFIDSELAQATYFAGATFSAADVMMTFPFTTMRHFLKYDLAPYANILAYLQRIESRPAYQKAMALAGPKDK